jgi:D-3-phosphoglycerate dehydrogenase / 2-oxoglutarate reductase
VSEARKKVLVKDKLGKAGIDLLEQEFDVVLGIDWDQDELVRRIGEFDGLVVRSAARVTAEVIEAGTRLKVIGRAGVGVDNIDVEAATRRGIVVVNAPQSNVLSAAEHTIAMLLACARNIPQAHGALKAGRWEKSRWGGVEVQDKTLGIIGLGRIGFLVAQRAKGLGMRVIAYDPYVPVERFRELDLDRADSPEKVYSEADFITVHLPKNAETLGFVDDEAFAQMKDGVRVVNVARGGIIDEESLARALESGKVAAAGVDVFPVEPTTDDLLLAYDAVVVTPHLGASTAEASVRAGTIIAEQVSAALKGELAGNAVNVPLVPGEEADELMPFLPVCRMLGELVTQLAGGPVDDLEITYEGNVARYDTRILTVSVLEGVLKNTVEDEVNFVSAGPMAEERGISYREEKKPVVTDFLSLVRVRAFDGEHELVVAGTTLGPRHRPRFVTVYGLDLDIEPVEHMVFVRAQSPAPGTFGKIGTLLGGFGVNVLQVSVAKAGEGEPGVMGLALDAPIGEAHLAELVEAADLLDAKRVEL